MKTFWSRICAAIACIGGGVSASTQSWAADDLGLVGSKLSVVQNTDDFFTFFHFVPIYEQNLPDGGAVTSFKPTGDSFHHLVTLNVNTDKNGVITKLRLDAARSFIDDPKKTIYAADLAKSFLTKAGPTSAEDAVGSLAREISTRTMSKSTVTMLTAQPIPQPPATISPAYQTYAGDPRLQLLLYSSGILQLELRNVSEDKVKVLEMTVSPKPR